MTADDLLPIIIAGAVGYVFSQIANRRQTADGQITTLAAQAEQIKTLFRRVDDIERVQDEHADEQSDIRDAVIQQGSHIEQAVGAINAIAERLDRWLGQQAPTVQIAPEPLKTPRLTTRRARASKRRRLAA